MTEGTAGADLFFYGTLCHLPLLRLVLQRDDLGVQNAVLADHAVHWVAEHDFPMIVAAPGAQARGVLLRGLTSRDVARLNFYEGGFVYDLREVAVQTDDGPLRAQVYFPQDGQWQVGAPWILADWVRRWGVITLHAAEEVMAHFGTMHVEEVRALWPVFCSRGWARVMAREAAPQSLRSKMTEADVTLHPKPGYDGFFRLRRFDVSHRRFDGAQSPAVTREGFVAFDAALVLPYDPVQDAVLLVEQVRYGPLMRGDPAPWVLEPIAGLVDAGEAPADAARREACEEAGLALGELMPMTKVYASPGYSSEFFHCYLGLCDLSARATQLGGLEHENEDIRSHVILFDRAMALIESGEINAGPLVMMLFWLAARRDGLRAAA